MSSVLKQVPQGRVDVCFLESLQELEKSLWEGWFGAACQGGEGL